jgi:hypothetical protein
MSTTLNTYVAATPPGMKCAVFASTGLNNPITLTTYGQGQPQQSANVTCYVSTDTVPTYGTLTGNVLAENGEWEWGGTGYNAGGFFTLRAFYCSLTDAAAFSV